MVRTRIFRRITVSQEKGRKGKSGKEKLRITELWGKVLRKPSTIVEETGRNRSRQPAEDKHDDKKGDLRDEKKSWVRDEAIKRA